MTKCGNLCRIALGIANCTFCMSYAGLCTGGLVIIACVFDLAPIMSPLYNNGSVYFIFSIGIGEHLVAHTALIIFFGSVCLCSAIRFYCFNLFKIVRNFVNYYFIFLVTYGAMNISFSCLLARGLVSVTLICDNFVIIVLKRYRLGSRYLILACRIGEELIAYGALIVFLCSVFFRATIRSNLFYLHDSMICLGHHYRLFLVTYGAVNISCSRLLAGGLVSVTLICDNFVIIVLKRYRLGSGYLILACRIGEELLASAAFIMSLCSVCFRCTVCGNLGYKYKIMTERRNCNSGKIGYLCGACLIRIYLIAVFAGIIRYMTVFRAGRFLPC